MAFTIFDAVTINISRVLEAVFDGLEYRLAKRALRHAAKARAKRRSPSRLLPDEVIAVPSEGISVRAT